MEGDSSASTHDRRQTYNPRRTMKPLPPEERKNVRFVAGIPAIAHLSDGEHPCHAHDLSRKGVRLVGALPRPTEKEEMRVTLRSGAGDLELELLGRVARVGEEADGEIGIGLSLQPLDDERAAILESLVSRVIEGRIPAPLRELAPGTPRNVVIAVLEKIPLPQRIALATRALPSERGFLLMDPQAPVLEALARNPTLTRAEVVKLLRMQNLLPTTVEILADDVRWTKDEEVRILVATHPRASLVVAEKVVASLKEVARLKVLRTPGLNPVLREKMTRQMTNKKRSFW